MEFFNSAIEVLQTLVVALGAGHHLHHLAGLVKLLNEFVHLLDVGARTLSDALAA